jgi:hypothetical protein
MSLAKKMYLEAAKQVPCVNLPGDVDLGDIHPWGVDMDQAKTMVKENQAPAMFVFVENSKQLEKLTKKLSGLWEDKVTFWLFYPKKPHLGTDLSRDETWNLMQQQGMKGTRQVGVDSFWSCMYFKA